MVENRFKVDHKKIMADVKANFKKLEDCPGPHDFHLDEEKTLGPLRNKFTCTLCGGTIRSAEFAWYQNGLEHGRGKLSETLDVE